MTDQHRSVISVALGAVAVVATQLGLGWLWAVGPPWFAGRGHGAEHLTPPIPSASFAISGAVGGWVAARLAPAWPRTHALAAAALPTLALLLWFASLPAAGQDWDGWAELGVRLGLLWLGAWLAASGRVLLRSARLPARAGV